MPFTSPDAPPKEWIVILLGQQTCALQVIDFTALSVFFRFPPPFGFLEDLSARGQMGLEMVRGTGFEPVTFRV